MRRHIFGHCRTCYSEQLFGSGVARVCAAWAAFDSARHICMKITTTTLSIHTYISALYGTFFGFTFDFRNKTIFSLGVNFKMSPPPPPPCYGTAIYIFRFYKSTLTTSVFSATYIRVAKNEKALQFSHSAPSRRLFCGMVTMPLRLGLRSELR